MACAPFPSKLASLREYPLPRSRSEPPRRGEKVTWNASGGPAHGKVVKKLTGRGNIKGHIVAATKDGPQYLVRSDNGGEAAHKASALKPAK